MILQKNNEFTYFDLLISNFNKKLILVSKKIRLTIRNIYLFIK